MKNKKRVLLLISVSVLLLAGLFFTSIYLSSDGYCNTPSNRSKVIYNSQGQQKVVLDCPDCGNINVGDKYNCDLVNNIHSFLSIFGLPK